MSTGDVLAILSAAVALGGLIWQVRDLKDKLADLDATATRSEQELIRLNASMDGKAVQSNTRLEEVEERITDHETRIRAIEGERRKAASA